MTLAQIKPHRKSIRLKNYDYSQNGYYFVTICTKNREEYFGQINDDEMILSQYGKIAKQSWLEIPEHFEDIRVDEHVIMPNHIHGIVIIESDDEPVGNRHACSLPEERQYQKLPIVIGSYKSSVTRKSNQIHDKFHFKWQKSYYDHIIRNDKSLDRIRHYIHYNALKWEYDQENKNAISFEEKKEFWKEFLNKQRRKPCLNPN
ncbi:transposase [candidate division KSB1 bacterium]|nr:transposase [candidate division KSB1 bacterium]